MKDYDKRSIAIERASILKSRIDDYLQIRDNILRGSSPEESENIEKRKINILDFFKASEEDWKDWHWQIKNRITEVDTLKKLIYLSEEEVEDIRQVEKRFRWAVSPYYLSLINDDKMNPVRLQSIPTFLELKDSGEMDPMGEEYTNPAGCITRRYPDRLIINVTNECAMYCRHCQRRRNIDTKDNHTSKETIMESIEYIKNNTEIRDVLITGGDALTLSDEMLDWLLGELKKIEHLEIIRIGTRVLVTMPQRITGNLVDILKKYPPIYINTHFNHPLEITQESKAACERLTEAGIPLGNQAVLLNGINNDKYVMRLLNQELLKCRVKPYYIFHAKNVKGTMHFNTSVDDGIEIMEYLRGYTSGLAIPTYIINAPGGKGKTPILPQYLVSRGKDYIKIRTWEGEILDYPNKPTLDLKKCLHRGDVS